jgi:MYXO-CTERM domain-containing protein
MYQLSRRILAPLLLATTASVYLGCASGAADEGQTEPDDGTPEVGQVQSALVASDPISKAVSGSCTTAVLAKLSFQLVDEIQCLRPRTLSKIDKIPNVTLGSAVIPYLQTAAIAPLAAVAKTRGTPLAVNSAMRTLAQQYLLYRWYQVGRCGIPLAAQPGNSNHESALALDVEDSASWRAAFGANGYRWLGVNDPVHYDFTKGGVTLRGLSVQAFQRLWNRNNPNDKIAEDGSYGPATESRLAKSPIGGFPIGAVCTPDDGGPRDAGPRDAAADGGDAGDLPPDDLPPAELPTEPDAPGEGSEGNDQQPPPGCGCRVHDSSGALGMLPTVAVVALLAAAARRRRATVSACPNDHVDSENH